MFFGDFGEIVCIVFIGGDGDFDVIGLWVGCLVLLMLVVIVVILIVVFEIMGIVFVEYKFDGVCIQVYCYGDEVGIFMWSFVDVIYCFFEIVDIVCMLFVDDLIFDGEIFVFDEEGGFCLFQEIMLWFGVDVVWEFVFWFWFFDVLYVDG